MVKVRMNTADVVAEVACLRRLIGMRCANVYDISPKTYLFKLMNSSGVTESGESEKVLLLMESGVRLHTTEYVRDKSMTPSGFTLKLRKHTRTKRLEDVRQLGYDRIILFQFGLGENAHYIILELYAQGNILLVDSNFVVMTLLRSHRDDNKGLAIMSRHRYPIEACRKFERTTLEKLQEVLSSMDKSIDHDLVEPIENDGHQEKTKKATKSTLKTVLGSILGYGPALSEHMILDAGLSPNMKMDQITGKIDNDAMSALIEAVSRFEDWLADAISGQKIPKGYILMKNMHGSKDNSSSQGISGMMYDEFCPILLNQFIKREFTEFETFDAAMDEFYSKIESQRSDQQKKAKEDAALQKLNKIRADQENRVQSLKKEVDHSIKMGELIEYNLEEVEAAIVAVRVALAKGMDWRDLARMIKEEKKMGNPIAGLIDKLHLERNCITLLLSKDLDEMDDDEITQPVDKVEVDLSLSAHANARRWYELKKKQEVKQEKTVSAHVKAFKAAEKKTLQQLAQEKTVATISHIRKVHWFEKFNWFISSENYLIISGRDAQQNEMIVKRYMAKGDIYVHADLHGASSTVIKNHNPDHPIPPLTLNQAGCYTVCQSKAWDSKMVTSAWWVHHNQVSKTAPTGEYLTVGSFMIRGRKNFLPPHPLVMGFGILFRLDESSLGSHLNERRVRGEEDESQPSISDSDTHPPKEETNDLDSIEEETEDHLLESSLEEIIDKALSLGPVKELNVKEEGLVPDLEKSVRVSAKGSGFLSKAERKKLKKGEACPLQNTNEGVKSKNDGSQKPPVQKVTRGQKGKIKKMKEKYADQDEEERKLRMALLASAGKVNAKSEEQKEEVVADENLQEAVPIPESSKICYKCKKPGHLSKDCTEDLEKPSENPDSLTVTVTSRNPKAFTEEEEEEGIHGITEEEKSKLTELDNLTGIPLPDDVLLYAVPVCGPYNALQSYKYRVKITPGTAKKGKVAKTAVNLFTHMPEATMREKELIKACSDPELIAAIIGNAKITAPGLTQLKQKQKKEKKSQKDK